jgi:hypothetical protein
MKQSTSKSGPSHKRKALKEQTNGQYGSDTEEVEGFEDQDYNNTLPTASNDELDVSMIAPKSRGRPAKPKGNEVKATKRRAVPASPKRKRPIQIPDEKIQSRTTVIKKVPIREEQHSGDNSEEEQLFQESCLQEEQEEPEEKPIRRGVVKQTSRTTRPSPVAKTALSRRRAGSASDAERVNGDPAIRRKLGEMTKKFEIIDLKYRNLREVAVKEAEDNFEKLKKRTDQKSKGKDNDSPVNLLY